MNLVKGFIYNLINIVLEMSDRMHCNKRFKNDYEEFGYVIFGPFLREFLIWLHSRITDLRCKKQNTRFFFLSREGIYIHKCYELIYGKMADADDLYISRKCVRYCDIAEANSVSELISAIDFRTNATIEILLDKCGIDLSLVRDQLSTYNTDLDDPINEDVYPFINSIFDIIQKTANDQMERLTQYLKELKFFSDTNIVFVDIGWRGTMQKTISRIYKKDVYGLYVGIIGNSIDGEAFLYDMDPVLEAGMTLIESLFMVDFGTTIGYESLSSGVRPILQDCEFEEEEYRLIYDIQSGAKEYYTNEKASSIEERNIVDKFVKVIIRPTLREAKLLGEISYFDSFKSKLAKVDFPRIRISFLNSGWKIGTLKLLLKVPFINYLKVYCCLKRRLVKK